MLVKGSIFGHERKEIDIQGITKDIRGKMKPENKI